MKNGTKTEIINIIKEKKQVKPNELVNLLKIKERAVFKQLRNLVDKGILGKVGTPPKVYYYIKKEADEIKESYNGKNKFIQDNFLIITPMGEMYEGFKGFIYWCKKNNLPIEKTTKEYEVTLKKYSVYKTAGLINGMNKLQKTFDKKIYLDKLFYLDFYSIERFGKTKLGWILLYAKQSQNKLLIKELVDDIKNKVEKIIKKYHISAVGFIPPTVKRDIQLMTELEKHLNFSLPVIKFQKIKTQIVIPQKTLSRLEDRLENAEKSIFLNDNRIFDNILLIDDAVGSGATINEAAKKIRQKKLAKGNIIGLAITGSYKGFEIISEI